MKLINFELIDTYNFYNLHKFIFIMNIIYLFITDIICMVLEFPKRNFIIPTNPLNERNTGASYRYDFGLPLFPR